MKNFLSISMFLMGIYVYNCIYLQNTSIEEVCRIKYDILEEYPICYPEEEFSSEIENYEKLSIEYQKKLFDKACESNTSQFIKNSINVVYELNPIGLLTRDITNMTYFDDYHKMGCFDYDKSNFIKKLYKHRIKEVVSSKSIIFQIVYYCLQYINIIVYSPVIITSGLSMAFVDLFY